MAAISQNRRDTRSKNPILWEELNHYRQSDGRSFPAHWRVLRYMVLLLLIGIIAATLLEVEYPTRELGIYTIWVVQAATAVRAIIAGANAISREHVGQTWDALVLTGIGARQILFGKWRAVLRRVAPWMLILGTLRLAMIPVFFMALTNLYAWLSVNYQGYSPSEVPIDINWVPWAMVLAVVMSVLLTVLDVACCTALGLAASAVTKRNVSAAVGALIIRFIPVAYFAAFTRHELGDQATSTYRVFRFAPFAIADSGTSPLSRLSVPYTPLSTMTHADALSGLVLATVVLILFLVCSLLAAWIAIRRNGALPYKKPIEYGERPKLRVWAKSQLS